MRLRSILLAAALALAACHNDVTHREARRLVATDGAQLVDVRARWEYEERHVPGALNVPVDEIERRLAELGPKDRPVVVYCHTGIRAGVAARLLRKAGFTRVYNLGAIGRWYVPERGAPQLF